MLKKILAAVSALALALGIVALTAVPASAHTPNVSATCSSGVNVNLTNYATSGSKYNTVTVYLGTSSGSLTQVDSQHFQASFQKTYLPTSYGIPSGPYWYHVVVTAWDSSQYNYDSGVKSVTSCPVTPGAPTFTNAVCTGVLTVGDASFTVPAVTTGVAKYQYRIGSTGAWTDIATGGATISEPAGTHVYIKAIAANGYSLGSPNTWDKTLTGPSPSSCTVSVTPDNPSFTDAVCTGALTVGQGSFSVPAVKTGVAKFQYRIGSTGAWVDVPAAGITLSEPVNTHVYVQAFPTTGYTLTKSSWDHTIGGPSASSCTVTVNPANPDFNDAVCTGPGSYGQGSVTIPAITTGVTKYQYSTASNSGPWTDAPAGGTTITVSAGTTVYVHAVADTAHGYTFGSNKSSWSDTIGHPSDCTVTVTPASPSFADAVCTGPGVLGNGSYTIPSLTTGVSGYEVKLGSGGSWAPATTGSHPVSAGTHVYVRADASSGYAFGGHTSAWDDVIGGGSLDCTVTVTPASPDFADAVCTGPGNEGQGSYTIPTLTSGVAGYQVKIGSGDWTDATSGTHSVDAGTHVYVKALPASGYSFGAHTSSWDDVIGGPDTCIIGANPAAPSFDDAVCTGPGNESNGSYTVPALATGVAGYQVKIGSGSWSDVAPGTYPAPAGTHVFLQAIAVSGYSFGAHTSSWDDVIAGPDTCVIGANPAAPDFGDLVCTEGNLSGGSYTIPATTTGVSGYQVKLGSGDWTSASAGTYPVASGTHVYVQAIPVSGYSFGNHASSWDHVITQPETCQFEFPAVGDPTFQDASCGPLGVVLPQYTTYATDHVHAYDVTITHSDSTTTEVTSQPAGTYVTDINDTVYIVPIADAGYSLEAPLHFGPRQMVLTSGDCLDTHPLVVPVVTYSGIGCNAGGVLSLTVTPSDLGDDVSWSVTVTPLHAASASTAALSLTASPALTLLGGSGTYATGKYEVDGAVKVSIDAIADENVGFASTTITHFEHTYDPPVSCGGTLAFTGSEVGGELGLLAALLVGGGIVVAARQRRSRKS